MEFRGKFKSHTMEWANPQADSLDPLTAAGDLRPVRFKSPEPWLMTLAPWLPWQDDPADPARQTKLLDYAPFAAIMWSFFLEFGESCPASHLFGINQCRGVQPCPAPGPVQRSARDIRDIWVHTRWLVVRFPVTGHTGICHRP